MRVGIFGGTFDPPHVGHLILAAEARDQLGLDRVLWVVTPDPPHKAGRTITPLLTRLDLVEAAICQDSQFEISRAEIDRPGPHYSVDTVEILARTYPQAELFYLMGGDSLHDLPTWKRPRQFIAALDGIGVMRRPQVFCRSAAARAGSARNHREDPFCRYATAGNFIQQHPRARSCRKAFPLFPA